MDGVGAGNAVSSVYDEYRRANGLAVGGGVGRGGLNATVDPANDKPGVYMHGFSGTRNGTLSNQAYGLQERGPGQSASPPRLASVIVSFAIFRARYPKYSRPLDTASHDSGRGRSAPCRNRRRNPG